MGTGNQGDDWTKKFLESLLYSKSDRLVIKDNDKGKNPFIWSQFQIAYIDGVEQKYACCNLCKTFIKYSSKTGTGGLMRHLCFRRMNMFKYVKKRKKMDYSKSNGKIWEKACFRLRLENLVQQNSPRIGYVRKEKGKSKIWSKFRIITVDNTVSKFACCMLCRTIVTYTVRTGTGSMVRHRCGNYIKCQQKLDDDDEADTDGVTKSEDSSDWDEKDCSDPDVNRTSLTIDEGDLTPKVEDSCLPEEVKKIIEEKMSACDDSSVRLFESEEFLELARYLVHLGARYGPIDVRDVLRTKTNIVPVNDNV